MTALASPAQLRRRTVIAGFLAVAMAATVGSALAFQYIGGYIPCKLCYEQRIPYYIGVPVMVLGGIKSEFGRIAERHPCLCLIVDHMGLLLHMVKDGTIG